MKRIVITEAMKAELRERIAQTGVHLTKLFRETGSIPSAIRLTTVQSWLSGATKTVGEDDWNWLIRTYDALPHAPPICADPPETNSTNHYRRVAPVSRKVGSVFLTDAMRKQFRSALLRTGINLPSLARLCSDDAETVTAREFSRWKFGSKKNVSAQLWEKAMEILAGLPDAPPNMAAHVFSGRNRTAERAASDHLLNQYDRTCPYPEDGPWPEPDLNPQDIAPPRKRFFPSSTVRKSVAGIEYIEITGALYRKLHEDVRRTCVSPKRLLRGRSDIPRGLHLRTISNWYLGKAKTAEKALWDYVLELYAWLPDEPEK